MSATSASQLLNALKWRYATKVFDPQRKIPSDTWTTLEHALVLAPSSFGLQPYRFLVIDSLSVRQELLPHSWKQPQVIDASHLVVFAARKSVTEAEIDAFINLSAKTRGTPPETLTIYRGMMTGALLNKEFAPLAPHWAAHQAYIALSQLMVSAALLGIDSCPLEGIIPAEYDRILNLTTEGLATVVCCALGYRSEQDKYASLPKVRQEPSTLIRHI